MSDGLRLGRAFIPREKLVPSGLATLAVALLFSLPLLRTMPPIADLTIIDGEFQKIGPRYRAGQSVFIDLRTASGETVRVRASYWAPRMKTLATGQVVQAYVVERPAGVKLFGLRRGSEPLLTYQEMAERRAFEHRVNRWFVAGTVLAGLFLLGYRWLVLGTRPH